MSGFSDYSARKIIDHHTGKTDIGVLPVAYLALFTTPPTDAGSGGTEVSGGSYARKQTAGTDWNAAAGSAPASAASANALAFPQATADWAPSGTPVWAFGVYDASSAGNLLWWDYLGNNAWLPCIVDAADLTADLIHAPNHGYSAGDPVVFTQEFGGSGMTGLTMATTKYFVIAAGLTADKFSVATTLGGSAVNLTADGNGMVRKVQEKVIQNGDTASFAAGNLQLLVA